MLNLKLQAIANFVELKDNVLDTCCDHAYLAIYLKENKLCSSICASDISKEALKVAKNNIKKANLAIPTYLSDGFKNISNSSIDTCIIAGVGATTIIDIVKTRPSTIKKFIISSNNDYELVRKYMQSIGFYLQKETVIFEHHNYYPIMLFLKSNLKRSPKSLKYGISNSYEYYKYLYQKEQNILTKIPPKYFLKRFKIRKDLIYFQKILKKVSQND